MAQDLAELEALVRGVVNRGTKFDSEISAMLRQSGRWLERNHTLEHMKRLLAVTLLAEDEDLLVQVGELKSIEFFRLVVTDSTSRWHYLKKRDPQDLWSRETGRPEAYWYESKTQRIYFDRPVDAAYDGQLYIVEYTEWPTTTSESNWLIENAEDFLMADALVRLSPIVRNPQLKVSWEPEAAKSLRTLSLADTELQYENSEAEMGIYTG